MAMGAHAVLQCSVCVALNPPTTIITTSPPTTRSRRGGSFYIQSKVWNAKEALLEDLRRQASASAAKGRATTTGGSGGGGAGVRFSGVGARDAGLFGGSGVSSFGGAPRHFSTAAAGGRAAMRGVAAAAMPPCQAGAELR
jgi:hypothetical protein